jgi:hypothetical protein
MAKTKARKSWRIGELRAAVSASRYVDDTGGIDYGLCDNPAIPCRTITFAMSQAVPGSPGDVIHVAPGTYNQALGEVFPIAVRSGVQLVASGNNAIINPAIQNGTSQNSTNPRVFNVIGANAFTRIEGFTITNSFIQELTGSTSGGAAILIDGGSQATITRNFFKSNIALRSAATGGIATGGAIFVASGWPVPAPVAGDTDYNPRGKAAELVTLRNWQ